jgi:hypothetical protein
LFLKGVFEMRQCVAVGVGLVAVLCIAWWWWREDPALVAARETQARLAALGENATEAERRALWEQMRGQMGELTDEQRRALFRDRQGGFENRMQGMIDGYFALGEQQRQAYLDQQIRAMEKRRAEMQQRFAQRPPNGGERGGPPRGDRPGGGGGERGPGGSGPGGGGGRGGARLDRSTPEQRAKSSAFFLAMEKRRKELGLPAMSMGRR